MLNKLLDTYETEHKFAPLTLDHLLDYYQKKYIQGNIDIKRYYEIYRCLHQEGAISSHDYPASN